MQLVLDYAGLHHMSIKTKSRVVIPIPRYYLFGAFPFS
jgi:hypothetical protein